MQRRNVVIIGGIIVVVLIVVGVILALGKPAAPHSSSASSSSNSASVGSVNNSVLITKTSPNLGQYLAEPNGTPLYIYKGDSANVSNCTGACLANWPAYQDTGATSNLPTNVSAIKRSDNGQEQYEYKDMPLYTFTSDTNQQVTGDGIANFSVARP